jgi:hypothetical protein
MQSNSSLSSEEGEANIATGKFIDWIGNIVELSNCLRQLKCADREKEMLINAYNRFRIELCEDISNKGLLGVN